MPAAPPASPGSGAPPAGRFFSPDLLLADAGVAAGLAFAQGVFLAGGPPAAAAVAVSGGVFALLGWIGRGHRRRGAGPGRLLARAAGVGLAAAVLLASLHAAGALAATPAQIIWLAAAAAFLSWVLRVARAAAPESPGAVVRWLAVTAAVSALVGPFWTADSLGAGDAHWYTIMLADFITQWRAGVFPVWVGQSAYAFNGAVSPLRFAPWFQHWGGVLDVLTAHALSPTALKNAILVTAAAAGGLAAYACLRAMLGRRPWLAAVLAVLWMASPGVLAPLMAGDQYMTFLTLPFVATVLYGIWRGWVRDDGRARLALAAGLAGLMLSHTPIALWMGLLAGANYAAKIIARKTWRLEPRRLLALGATFLLLGSFPLLSVLALDNVATSRASGGAVFPEIARIFPANFLPIDRHHDPLASYQLGYVAIGALVLTVLFLAVARPRGAVAFVGSAILIAPFTLPVPWITRTIWVHLPEWFVTINNVWPMQRLFLIWAAVIFFGLAAVVAHERLGGRRWLCTGLTLALFGGGAWSWHEARLLMAALNRTRSPAASAGLLLDANNVLITRYAYTNFLRTPAYFSHGYMDPGLENRLLDRDTLQVLASNAEAAAPRLALDEDQPARAYPRLVQSGVLTAVNDNHSEIYNLTPAITLQPDVSYALRLSFAQSDVPGVLEIMHERLFREYYLPDSGVGMPRWGPSLAFGSGPQSAGVIPLRVTGAGAVTPRMEFVTSSPEPATFPFAHFSLFTYDAAQLPVAVESLVPYRVRVQTATPAWLETPRVWQSGWRALVNGREAPTRRSPQDLVMIPVEPGGSRVLLTFAPPWWLQWDYWISLAGWGALFLAGAARIWRAASHSAQAI